MEIEQVGDLDGTERRREVECGRPGILQVGDLEQGPELSGKRDDSPAIEDLGRVVESDLLILQPTGVVREHQRELA